MGHAGSRSRLSVSVCVRTRAQVCMCTRVHVCICIGSFMYSSVEFVAQKALHSCMFAEFISSGFICFSVIFLPFLLTASIRAKRTIARGYSPSLWPTPLPTPSFTSFPFPSFQSLSSVYM